MGSRALGYRLYSSVEEGRGSDQAPKLINELVPGLAAMADDVVMRGKDAVVEPIVAHELPDVIDRL